MTKGARVLLLTAGAAVWAVLGYACSADDENPATNRPRGSDGGSDGTVDPQGQTDAPSGSSLCDKYGGYTNVKSIADKIIDRAAADCRISQGFSSAQGDDQLQHLKECFEIQLGGSAFKCSGVTYSSNTTTDSKGNKCRDMASAHKNIAGNGKKLRNADFDAFVEAASAEFAAAGITDKADLTSLAAFFEGTRNLVVQEPTQPKANTFCTDTAACPTCKPVEAGVLDSGKDTGTTDSGTDADAADQ